MKNLIKIILDSVNHIKKFEDKYDLTLPEDITDTQLKDWKEVDRNKSTPEGYKRYIEKRKGRDIPGHKKSDWVHGENAEFVRNYASKNPKEDFADTFAFVVLGKEFNFKGNDNKKIDIIKDYLG